MSIGISTGGVLTPSFSIDNGGVLHYAGHGIPPVDVSVINISDLQLGTFVRITFPIFARHRNTNIDIDGLFIRRMDDRSTKPVAIRPLSKILRLVGRSFHARVIGNNSTTRQLTVIFRDKPSDGRVFYEIIIPYNEMLRISRLVPNARSLTDMTLEEEQAQRDITRRSTTTGEYFHPRDRFVPVRIV